MILFSLLFVVSFAQQTENEKLIAVVQAFHQALVNKHVVSLNQQTDKALSYGHSNGWVETKKELISNLETGLISYQGFKEDSIEVNIHANVANVRFKAEINASMNGASSSLKLRVLEVWVKKSKRWVLFARKAVRQL